jgi:DNA-directed RNA polymerase specialized sigma24 family protein
MPPDKPRQELPAEIAALSREEFRSVFEQAMQIVLGFTKSKARTDELMQTASLLLFTTRRWNPRAGPILGHLLGIVRSVLSHSYRHENSERGARAAHARESFQREVAGTEAASPEDETIDGTATEERRAEAERELDELAASVADHADAPRVLRSRRDADGKKKAADIARELDLPVERVYRANKLLLNHLRRIRAKRGTEKAGDAVAPLPERSRKDDDSEMEP